MANQNNEDTDRHAAIRFEHASPTGMRWIDRMIGNLIVQNGGYGEITLRFEKGQMRMTRILTSFMPDQWRHDVSPFPKDT